MRLIRVHSSLLAFAVAGWALVASAATAREKVIFDTDIGGDPDDGLALTYLLKEPRCDLEGIVDWDGFVDPYVTTPLNLPADEGRAYTAQSPDLRFLRGYYAEQWYSRPHNLYFHDPIAAVAIFHPEICTYEPSAVKIDVNDRGISYRTKDASKWTWQTLRAVDFEKFREIYISVMSK
jgi:inosine-uridine nucleoside N-ribohydrolase